MARGGLTALFVMAAAQCQPLLVTAARAQSSIECVAATAGPYGYRHIPFWPDLEWQTGRDRTPKSSDEVARRLRGSYRVLAVASEGVGPKRIAEWRLELEPTSAPQDSVWKSHPLYGSRTVHFPLVGQLRFVRSGVVRDDSEVVVDTAAPSPQHSVRIRYRPDAPEVLLETGPFETADAGTLYWIYYVHRDGRLFGRWSDGGYAVRLMQTPFGTIGEHTDGYFCAIPLRD